MEPHHQARQVWEKDAAAFTPRKNQGLWRTRFKLVVYDALEEFFAEALGPDYTLRRRA